MDHQRTDAICQAIASGEFHRARRLWDEYVTGIREEIGRGACTQARMAEIAELVEWSCGVVLCARAHAQVQLTSSWVASQYGPGDSPTPSCFRTSL